MARPRKFDEGNVLAAARDRFWRTGYEGTSISDLTEATGVGAQSLYGAFGSKHDLFVRILEEYGSSQAERLETTLSSEETPLKSLLSGVVFEGGAASRPPAEGCLLSNSATALSSRDEDVKRCAVTSHAATRDLFSRQVSRAQAAGEIDPALDPDQTALALVTVQQGIEYLRKCGIGDDEYARARDAAVDLLVRGLR